MSCTKDHVQGDLQPSTVATNHSPERTAASTYVEQTSYSKKGCKLYKKGDFYIQEIDLAQGAQLKVMCNSILINSNNQPISSTDASSTNSSPWVEVKTISDWYNSNKTLANLWSFTNATFFGYSESDLIAKSSLPVKSSGSIKSCGLGTNPADQAKRIFFVNWEGDKLLGLVQMLILVSPLVQAQMLHIHLLM